MGGSKKSKRVIWPSDDNLCQVKLFLSEDNPAQVGSDAQDHLQAKAWQSHLNFPVADDNLPPGFEGTQPTNIPWNKLSQIPLIKWRCPPRFKLDESWRVTAGEESIEFHIENDRVKKVLEAIYPRESAIPPNPVDAVNLESTFANDKPPIHIPITPIEDEDPSAVDFADSVTNFLPVAQTSGSFASSSHNVSTPNSTVQGVDPAVLAAASAALSAVMDQGNLIDPDLLIRILGDPKMIEQLVKNHGPSTMPQAPPPTNTQNMVFNPTQTFPVAAHNLPVTSMQMQNHNRVRPLSHEVSYLNPLPNPVGRSAQVNRAEFVAAPLTTASKEVFYPPQGPMGPGPNSRPPVPDIRRPPGPDIRPDIIPPEPSQPVRKDINYYKSLIQQHGNDMQEAPPHYGGGGGRSNHHGGYPGGREQPPSNGRSREWKHHPKTMKPCLYYNTEKGCRNGTNCAFQHDDKPVQRRVDSQSSKRMKMDREITGT